MKNKNLVLLVLGVLLIITIIFLVYYLGNNDTNNPNNNGENINKTLIQIIKENPGETVQTDDTQKVEYNQMMIDSDNFKYLLKIGKVAETCVDGNEFSDEQKLSFATCYALVEDYENLEKNTKGNSLAQQLDQERPAYVNFEYLNEISKKFFGKEIIKENIINYNFDGEYVEISFPTNAPENLYKFKEIKYNELSDVYSIYFDEINPLINNYEEITNTEKLEYNSDAVKATYRILYRKNADGNVILGIHQIL